MDYSKFTVGSRWKITQPPNTQWFVEIVETPNLWELAEYNLKGYVLVKGVLVASNEPIRIKQFSLSLGQEISVEPLSDTIYQFWQNMCPRV